MKKWIAMLLCVMMMVSACAFAEPAEFSLKDIKILSGETAIYDFSGIEFKFQLAETEEMRGVRLAVECNGLTAMEGMMQATDVEEPILLTASGLSDVYSFMYMGDGSVPFPLDQDVEEETFEAEVEEELEAVLGSELMDYFDGFAREDGVQEIDGVNYEVTTIEMTEAQGDELIDTFAMAVDTVVQNMDMETEIPMVQMCEILEIGLKADGTILEGEYEDITDITITGSLYGGEEEASLNIYVHNNEDPATEDTHIEFAFTVKYAAESYTLSGTIETTGEVNTDWLPIEVSGEVIDLATITDAQAEQAETELSAAMVQGLSLLMANPSVAELIMMAMMSSAEGY